MTLHPMAGRPATRKMLVDLTKLELEYYERLPDLDDPRRLVSFGTSEMDVRASELAGEPIVAKITRAPGNDEPIGGIKVVTANGWFAVRPSGTENIYKIYAESFRDQTHVDAIVEQAKLIVNDSLATARR